jgi:hypothetical protein
MEAGDDGVWRFLEFRGTTPSSGSGGHDDEALRQSAEMLGDCRAALVSKIGPGAERTLSRAGITAFEKSGPMDCALQKLAAYYARTEGRLQMKFKEAIASTDKGNDKNP